MSEKILCVLASYDPNTETRLSSIQNGLYAQGFEGTHTRNLPQHITLCTKHNSNETDLWELVKRVSAASTCFEVTFNHIGIFDGGKVLFVAPDTNAALLSLKENFEGSFDWTPHTTMLIDSPENILRATSVVAGTFSKFRGKVTHLHLYEFWPTRHILTSALQA